jgi:hypothetical protein
MPAPYTAFTFGDPAPEPGTLTGAAFSGFPPTVPLSGGGVDNFNDSLPAAPSGGVNVKWQADPASSSPRNISAYVLGTALMWVSPTLSANLVAPADEGAHWPGRLSIPAGLLVDLSASTGHTLLEVI